MFGISTGISSDLYRVALVVHILVSIVGFGAVLLNGVYAAHAQKRPGAEGRAISEANYAVSTIGEIFILAVPLAGLALVWASDGVWKLSDLWIWLSLVLFGVALVISRVVLMPGHRRTNQLLAEPDTELDADPSQRVAELDRIGKTMAASGATLNLLLVAILVLMIWKPAG